VHATLAEFYRKAGVVEGRVLVFIEAHPLADNDCRGRQAQVRMKLCSGGILNAVRRPRTASFRKAHVRARVPIAGGVDQGASAFGGFYPLVEDRNHFVAIGHRQGAACTEVALDIDDDQGIPTLHLRLHESSSLGLFRNGTGEL
jgi:hypothetical protein